MALHNREIAGIFSRLADLLEVEGANPYRRGRSHPKHGGPD